MLDIFNQKNKKDKVFDYLGFVKFLNESGKKEEVFDLTQSHFSRRVYERYEFVAEYLSKRYNFDLNNELKGKAKTSVLKKASKGETFEALRLKKPMPISITIEDLLQDVEENRFMIRPNYQRSETKKIEVASNLIESILLDIKVPPLFVYKRKNGVSEVVDGQQRLLTIIGFIGGRYKDENGENQQSSKHLFKLKNMKILSELEGLNANEIESQYETYYDKILDFQLDIIEIAQEQNDDFEAIDLFLRLNTKPYPIQQNSFEMWNSVIEKTVTDKIKNIASEYKNMFKRDNSRMKAEELLTSLIYFDYNNIFEDGKLWSFLTIFSKDEKINMRITTKKNITRFLENDLEKNQETFMESIKNIEDFVNRMNLLLELNEIEIDSIFDPKMNNNKHRTNQNIYVLWILMNSLQKNEVVDNREMIIKRLKKIYLLMQNFEKKYSVNHFKILLESKIISHNFEGIYQKVKCVNQ